jgi:hypothetical protein
MNRMVGALLRAKSVDERTENSARAALEMARDHSVSVAPLHLISAQRNLMVALAGRSRHEAAIEIGKDAHNGFIRHLGMVHPATISMLRELIAIVIEAGKYAEAEPLLRRAVAGCTTLFGEEHHDSLGTMMLLAQVVALRGELGQARELFREPRRPKDRTLPPAAHSTASAAHRTCRASSCPLMPCSSLSVPQARAYACLEPCSATLLR